MGLISAIAGVFRRGTPGFTEFERRVLDAVAAELSSENRDRFFARVHAVNLVQRLDGGREINCFTMREGRAVLDDATRINDSTGEREFARVRVDGPPGTANSGKVWLVEGNLFSIEFDEPTEHTDLTAVRDVRVELLPDESSRKGAQPPNK
jgi:hypothetical protein